MLHPGHHFYLARAKELGDHLSVVVTSDAHAERTKRRPKHDLGTRARAVANLEPVDEVIHGPEPYDLAGVVQMAQPEVIALGWDQAFSEDELQAKLAGLGFEVTVVRLPRWGDHSTTVLLDGGHD